MPQTSPTPPLSEQQLRIIQTARAAFLAKGINAVTMDDIARQLQMSKRTLYQLFADKETLLLACMRQNIEERQQQTARLVQQSSNMLETVLIDFQTRLREITEVNPKVFTEILRYPKVRRLFEEHRQANAERAVLFLQNGVEQGLMRADIDYELLYNVIADSFEMIMREPYISRYTPERLYRHLVLIYFRGCTTPRGTAIMDEFLRTTDGDTSAD